MSFQISQRYKRKYKELHRKEKDSILTPKNICIHKTSSNTPKERTSPFTSKGSITPEATLATSFFFFTVLCLIYLFEILAIQTNVKSALYAVGKEVALEAYTRPVIPTTKMERQIAEIIGIERLENSMVVGGSSGFDCSASKKYWNTTIMDLTVCYELEVPVLLFRLPLISNEETIRVKGWTGHEVKLTDSLDNVMVYVTDYGLVYHADRYCNYLDLSVKTVEKAEMEHLRNESGGIYKECLLCKRHGGEKCYITDYGDRYHKSLECSGLKRNIYTLSLEDAHGLGGCSKCVK